jgi:hypothetical protein
MNRATSVLKNSVLAVFGGILTGFLVACVFAGTFVLTIGSLIFDVIKTIYVSVVTPPVRNRTAIENAAEIKQLRAELNALDLSNCASFHSEGSVFTKSTITPMFKEKQEEAPANMVVELLNEAYEKHNQTCGW